MPDYRFFAVEQDELRIVEILLNEGCWLLPDIDYKSPVPLPVFSKSDFLTYRALTRMFFVLNERYLESPIEMRSIRKNDRIVYYLNQNSGGPAIEFLAGGTYKQNEKLFIREGFLSYAKFWDPREEKLKPPPQSLTALYKRLIRQIRPSAIRIKPGDVEFALLEGVQAALRDGACLVGLENYSHDELLK